MTYTQEMQLLSYYVNDIAEIVMAHSYDIHYGQDYITGHFCGLTINFSQDYVAHISCADFEITFEHQLVEVANDSPEKISCKALPAFSAAKFNRGNMDDLRLWRLKLYQYKQTAA